MESFFKSGVGLFARGAGLFQMDHRTKESPSAFPSAGRSDKLLPMRSALLFLLAGLFEIGGGYLVWLWLREKHGVALGIAGFILLALYGVIPVLQSTQNSFGRLYAAYGAVFIVLSMLWGWWIDGRSPDTLDLLGAGVCLVGATLMMWPRAA